MCALIQARCRCQCQSQCQSQLQLQLQLQLRSQLWSMAKRVQHELFNGLGMPWRGHVRRRHLAECVPKCVCVCVAASVCECPLISFACRPFIKAKSDGTHNNAQWAKNRKNQSKVMHRERERRGRESRNRLSIRRVVQLSTNLNPKWSTNGSACVDCTTPSHVAVVVVGVDWRRSCNL